MNEEQAVLRICDAINNLAGAIREHANAIKLKDEGLSPSEFSVDDTPDRVPDFMRGEK